MTQQPTMVHYKGYEIQVFPAKSKPTGQWYCRYSYRLMNPANSPSSGDEIFNPDFSTGKEAEDHCEKYVKSLVDLESTSNSK